MIYRIEHVTEYLYDELVATSYHDLHLTPRPSEIQICHDQKVTVTPHPRGRREHTDYFGNRCLFLEIHEPHHRLEVVSRSTVEVLPTAAPEPNGGPAWEIVRDSIRRPNSVALLAVCDFAFESPYVRIPTAAAEYAARSFTPGRPVVEAAIDLTRRIYTDFSYDRRATSVSTPVDEVMALRRGVCQDFAHLQIACLRALGLPARYVSGYLVTRPPAGRPRLVGADASHAWVGAYCGAAGWVPLDPTNNAIPNEQHITLAWGRDFGDVTPMRGVITGGGKHQLNVSVDVTPADAEADGDVSTEARGVSGS
ncbi:MAG TPA: transglutaminase family protein [Polyangia bacterium]|jgi:transglutaminase-like putative cysteine protease|nr:transglutaminase family protein [Polyangia bacterium]